MVKRQKDKQYLTATEHRQLTKSRPNGTTTSRPLPFSCCALTFTPFTNPVCTPQGILFDASALLPHVLKHKTDPVTGKPLTSQDVITLHMDCKEEEGLTGGAPVWQCPVLNKPFLPHTKVCAILQPVEKGRGREANVYSWEAVQQLNIKPRNYVDLITGEPFDKKKDLLVLHDPNDAALTELRDIKNFWHYKTRRSEVKEKKDSSENVKLSITASRIMEKMNSKKREQEAKAKEEDSSTSSKKPKLFASDVTGTTFTSGKASGSFTSTSMTLSNATQESREATEGEVLDALCAALKQQKQKGVVRLITTVGDIDLQLECDIVPKTCINFLTLVEEGKYDGTKFHRLIPKFMIQGGKPSQKSEDEGSIWGGAFDDEFDDRLKHAGRGILSMANAGPNTNKRQFFITFLSAPHLDQKHSVFGRVVNGLDTLDRMEAVPIDKKDRPLDTIQIVEAQIIQNPLPVAKESERLRIQKQVDKRRKEKEERKLFASGTSVSESKVTKAVTTNRSQDLTIGRYLPKPKSNTKKKGQSQKEQNSSNEFESIGLSRLPRPPKKTSFGDFSSW